MAGLDPALPAVVVMHRLDPHLRVVAAVTATVAGTPATLSLRLEHEGQPVGTLHFTVTGHAPHELEQLARSVPDSPDPMQAIDAHLAGDTE